MKRFFSDTYKIFPYCQCGDRISVEFKYPEERDIFLELISKLKLIDEDEFDFTFATTLEGEVAREYVNEIKKIMGYHVINVFVPTAHILRNFKE